MDEQLVQLVLDRLRTAPLPEQNAAQVAFQLGWLEALTAVAQALDLPEARVRGPRENCAPAARQPSGTPSGAAS